MQEKVKEALEGRITLEELSDDERVSFHKAVREAGQEELRKLTAFRAAKRDEEEKVRKAQEKVADAEAELKKLEEAKNNTRAEITQFRSEQVDKAKTKFFADFKVEDARKAEIEEKFARLDTGKVDPELIFKDLVSAYAAVDPEGYLTAVKSLADMKQNADIHNADQSGTHSSAPGGQETPKFDEATMRLAKDANITPEAADKTMKEGLSRRYN